MRSIRLFILMLFAWTLNTEIFCQTFTEVTSINIVNYRSGEVHWVDYDADGDLDIYLSGSSSGASQNTQIYANNEGTFVELNGTNLTLLRRTSSSWADLNNDGLIDMVRIGIQGSDLESIVSSFIAFNNGDGTFNEVPFPNNDTFESGKVLLSDLNNDGAIDIFITGSNKLNVSEVAIYANNRDGTFTKVNTNPIRGVIGQANIGDFDLDGDKDILLSGREIISNSNSSISLSVFKNEGDWKFTEVNIETGSELLQPFANWGDINEDGYLDIITVGRIRGNDFSLSVSLGSTSGFSLITDTGLPELGFSPNVDFLDYNNDGLLDILLAGSFNSGDSVRLYQNNGNNTFVEVKNTNFLNYISAQWDIGDFDGDSDQDIIFVGQENNFKARTTIFRNESQPNQSPFIPNNLSATVNQRSVNLQWNSTFDQETDATSITYNIRVGTRSGGIDIMAPNALPIIGSKYIRGAGNAEFNETYSLTNLPDGDYFWAVQAIDNGLESSQFSNEGMFSISGQSNTPSVPANFGAEYLITDNIKLTWNDLSFNETSFTIERAKGSNGTFSELVTLPANTTVYNDADVINNEIYTYRIRSGNGILNSNFSNEVIINSPLQGIFSNMDTLALVNKALTTTATNIVDFNNDGLQDLFFLNQFDENQLFKNLGNNNYIEVENNELIALDDQSRSSNWGDFNNDGLSDVFVALASVNQLFINNGNDSFTRVSENDFISVEDSNGATWGDVDGDGFIDLYVANGSSTIGELYTNINGQSFGLVEAGEINKAEVTGLDAIFLDINNDLYQDLYVSRYFDTNLAFFNDQNGILINQQNNALSEFRSTSVGSSWSDYDNDGDFDVLVTNNVNQSDQFYENDGKGDFKLVSNLIVDSDIRGTSSAWLDFDNDGWEDIVLVTDNSKVLMRNLGNGDFELIDEYALSSSFLSSSVVAADLNNDGFQEIIVGNSLNGQPNEYFFNNGNNNNWLKIKAIGSTNNKNAIGTKVQVDIEDMSLTKQILTNSGNDAQSGFIQHFGLGNSEMANIQLFWPQNGIQIVSEVSANQLIEIEEVPLPAQPTNLSLVDVLYNEVGIAWTDESNIDLGFIVYRTESTIGIPLAIDTVDAGVTSYTDITVASGTQYIYNVRSFISEGTSFNSNDLQVVTPAPITSLRENIISNPIKVYPNPALQHWFINLETDITGNGLVKILDLNGREIYQREFNKSNTALELKVPTNMLESGAYIMTITLPDNTWNSKVLVE